MARRNIDEFREEHADVLEEWHELLNAERAAVETAKNVAREFLPEDGKGKQTLFNYEGQRVTVTYKSAVDVEALREKHPDIIDVAKVKMTINASEVKKLVATGYLKKKEVEAATMQLSPSLSIEVIDLGQPEEDDDEEE